MVDKHRIALRVAVPLAAGALLGLAGPASHAATPAPAPPAITGEVLNWLGLPVYYRIEPKLNPLTSHPFR